MAKGSGRRVVSHKVNKRHDGVVTDLKKKHVGRQMPAPLSRFRPRRTRQPAIVCTECQGTINLKKDIVIRGTEKRDNVLEMGMECPKCKHWYHVMFEDSEVRRLREKFKRAHQRSIDSPENGRLQARANQLLEEFRSYLEEFNNRLREESGVKAATISEGLL